MPDRTQKVVTDDDPLLTMWELRWGPRSVPDRKRARTLTPRQMELAKLFRAHGSAEAVAARLGVHHHSVQETLDKARAALRRRAEVMAAPDEQRAKERARDPLSVHRELLPRVLSPGALKAAELFLQGLQGLEIDRRLGVRPKVSTAVLHRARKRLARARCAISRSGVRHPAIKLLLDHRDKFHVLTVRQRRLADLLVGGLIPVEVARRWRCSKATISVLLRRSKDRIEGAVAALGTPPGGYLRPGKAGGPRP